jgi:hypothetical protein
VTLQVGDKAVVIPLRDGGRVAVRSGTLSVGDKAVLIPGANGQIYAVRPASPQVGDKVILYPLRNGGHVCLASADDEGGSSPSVMPPGNFDARRTGPSTADLKWLPGEGNTAVRIVRRPDRYPVHINDGTVAYEGAGREATDTGLDRRLPYYYCAWGRAGSKYSNGYLMDMVGAWGTSVASWLVSVVDHDAQNPSSNSNCLGPNPNWQSATQLGPDGWIKVAFDPKSNLHAHSRVTVYEGTAVPPYLFSVDLNPNAYIYPNCYSWTPVPGHSETYDIGFIYPNILYVKNVGGTSLSGHLAGAYLHP